MANNDKEFDLAFSNAIDEVLKDWKASMKEAVNSAVQEAQKDFMNKSLNCLQEYYNNHSPDVYDRTNTLRHAFLPYLDVKEKRDKIVGSVGVQYDASILEQYIGEPVMYMGRDGVPRIKHVGYYGSAKHQPVDAWWVLDNYLNGIHPDGSANEEDYIVDYKSPNQKMDEYQKSYAKTFDENVLFGLLRQVAKKMK
jgi:hypothetical protein